MLFSRTSQYAVQALTYLATQRRDRFVLTREIADNLRMPTDYLGKIMGTMSRAKLLRSLRGRKGGYVLDAGAEGTDMLQVLLLMEGRKYTEDCFLGFKACADETACPMHGEWKPIKEGIVACLREQSIGALAAGVKRGDYRLTDLPLHVADLPAWPGRGRRKQ